MIYAYEIKISVTYYLSKKYLSHIIVFCVCRNENPYFSANSDVPVFQ
jgi:hypothetical protein